MADSFVFLCFIRRSGRRTRQRTVRKTYAGDKLSCVMENNDQLPRVNDVADNLL